MHHIGCDHNGDNIAIPVFFCFSADQLIYDIDNCAFVEGHIMDENAQHAQHSVIDICQDGNRDRVLRVIDVAVAAAKEMLYPFTKSPVEDDSVFCDDLASPDCYGFPLFVPKSMSQSTLDLIHKLVHEFIVYRVLYDWLSITNPEAAPHWLDKALEASAHIAKVKNLRTGFSFRPLQPF